MWIGTVLGQEEYKVRSGEWMAGAEQRRLAETVPDASEAADRGWSFALAARFSLARDTIWRAMEAVGSSAGRPAEPECC